MLANHQELGEKSPRVLEEIELDSNSFVEMMVLDACFIVELFHRVKYRCQYDDPILKLVLLPTIITDLIMLENQIPFFILQHLFDLVSTRNPPLVAMALNFFSTMDVTATMLMKNGTNDSNLQFHHLLHFLHSNLIPSLVNDYPKSNYPGLFPCASKLQESGIKLKKGVASSFLGIKYHDREIEIPTIVINQISETIFLNFVAFEQCYPHQLPYVTSYIIFMDQLISSSQDVRILCKKGIILEQLGSPEDVAALFSKIGREAWVYMGTNYLAEITERIKQSSKRLWPRFRPILKRDYFNSPWASISLLAGIVLLLLTLFQTFFSAFPKYAWEK